MRSSLLITATLAFAWAALVACGGEEPAPPATDQPAVQNASEPASSSGTSILDRTQPPPRSVTPEPVANPRFTGKIRLRDFWSADRIPQAGSFRLVEEIAGGAFDGEAPAAPSFDALVRDGVWSIELPPDRRFGIEDLVLDGHPAQVASGSVIDARNGYEPVVVAERRTERTLHVTDAATGQALENLTVVTTGLAYEARLPGASDQTALFDTPVSSPFTFEPQWPRRIHVRAPGYAWGSIALHESLAGEPTLALERSGSVDVRLTGEVAQSGYRLRVRASGASILEEPADGGRLLAVDLPPGDYALSIESGGWDWPCVHGSTEVQVTAGERTEATIEIAPEPLPATVKVPARFHIAREWETEVVELELRLIGGEFAGLPESDIYKYKKFALKQEDEETWSFEQRLLPGVYELTLTPAGLLHTIQELDPSDLAAWNFSVPPPGKMRVRVEDKSGKPLLPERIWWDFTFTDGYPHGSAAPNADGVYELRIPQTTVVLRSGDRNWLIVPHEHQVGEDTEITLQAEPVEGLLLSFEDANVNPLRLDPWWRPRLEPAPAAGVYMTRAPGGYHIALEGPGHYRLRLPPIDGFEPFAEQEIEVAAGQVLEVRVPLRPAK